MAAHENMVPVVYDASYDRYFFGPSHPFSPVRQHMVLDLLEALGEKPHIVAPPPATTEQILSVHSPAYIRRVEDAGQGRQTPDAKKFGLGTPDVPIFGGMDEAARILTGGSIHAAEMVVQGEAPIVLQFGGGLHHAHHALASGFCVYNDVSCAIRHFRDNGWRVAYLDIDVHHGDGVQAIHYEESEVLTISLHESGHYLYPGTGAGHEIGRGDGRGFSINIPFEPDTTDSSYLDIFEQVVPHALAWFQPDVMVIQAGADAHFRDPLADLLLTSRAYEQLYRRILELVESYAAGRAVFTLGGGYDLDSTSRMWTMLYLILNDRVLPEQLPETYLETWRPRLTGAELTPTLHDDEISFDSENASSLEEQNRMVSRRVLELVASYWY